MSLRDESTYATTARHGIAPGGRIVWHAVAMLVAAALAWLILAAYRQPDFILELAAMRLC